MARGRESCRVDTVAVRKGNRGGGSWELGLQRVRYAVLYVACKIHIAVSRDAPESQIKLQQSRQRV
jgi:hypothetical protein